MLPLPRRFRLIFHLIYQFKQILSTVVDVLPDELFCVRRGPGVAASTADEYLAIIFR